MGASPKRLGKCRVLAYTCSSDLTLPFSPAVEMTEEEQFALALKMSEQEARQVNCQEEEEEELLRKAIAESLNVSVLL